MEFLVLMTTHIPDFFAEEEGLGGQVPRGREHPGARSRGAGVAAVAAAARARGVAHDRAVRRPGRAGARPDAGRDAVADLANRRGDPLRPHANDPGTGRVPLAPPQPSRDERGGRRPAVRPGMTTGGGSAANVQATAGDLFALRSRIRAALITATVLLNGSSADLPTPTSPRITRTQASVSVLPGASLLPRFTRRSRPTRPGGPTVVGRSGDSSRRDRAGLPGIAAKVHFFVVVPKRSRFRRQPVVSHARAQLDLQPAAAEEDAETHAARLSGSRGRSSRPASWTRTPPRPSTRATHHRREPPYAGRRRCSVRRRTGR